MRTATKPRTMRNGVLPVQTIDPSPLGARNSRHSPNKCTPACVSWHCASTTSAPPQCQGSLQRASSMCRSPSLRWMQTDWSLLSHRPVSNTTATTPEIFGRPKPGVRWRIGRSCSFHPGPAEPRTFTCAPSADRTSVRTAVPRLFASASAGRGCVRGIETPPGGARDCALCLRDGKDPACDIIIVASNAWANAVSWKPGPPDA